MKKDDILYDLVDLIVNMKKAENFIRISRFREEIKNVDIF